MAQLASGELTSVHSPLLVNVLQDQENQDSSFEQQNLIVFSYNQYNIIIPKWTLEQNKLKNALTANLDDKAYLNNWNRALVSEQTNDEEINDSRQIKLDQLFKFDLIDNIQSVFVAKNIKLDQNSYIPYHNIRQLNSLFHFQPGIYLILGLEKSFRQSYRKNPPVHFDLNYSGEDSNFPSFILNKPDLYKIFYYTINSKGKFHVGGIHQFNDPMIDFAYFALGPVFNNVHKLQINCTKYKNHQFYVENLQPSPTRPIKRKLFVCSDLQQHWLTNQNLMSCKVLEWLKRYPAIRRLSFITCEQSNLVLIEESTLKISNPQEQSGFKSAKVSLLKPYSLVVADGAIRHYELKTSRLCPITTFLHWSKLVAIVPEGISMLQVKTNMQFKHSREIIFSSSEPTERIIFVRFDIFMNDITNCSYPSMVSPILNYQMSLYASQLFCDRTNIHDYIQMPYKEHTLYFSLQEVITEKERLSNQKIDSTQIVLKLLTFWKAYIELAVDNETKRHCQCLNLGLFEIVFAPQKTKNGEQNKSIHVKDHSQQYLMSKFATICRPELCSVFEVWFKTAFTANGPVSHFLKTIVDQKPEFKNPYINSDMFVRYSQRYSKQFVHTKIQT